MLMTANISIGEKRGKNDIMLMDYLKNSQLLIFYFAPVLSRKDNGLLIQKENADSLRREL